MVPLGVGRTPSVSFSSLVRGEPGPGESGAGLPKGLFVGSDERKQLEAQVWEIVRLRVGREKKITRAELVWTLRTCGFLRGVSDDHADRRARDAIETLRKTHPEGGRIVSLSETSGYWWSDDKKEIAHAQAEDVSRIDNTRAKMRNREALLQRLEADPLMEARLFP